MLDWNANDTYWYVSDKNMMLNHSDCDGGVYDSIERTYMAYYAYGDERFINGIKSCWTKVYRTNWLSKLIFGDYYYQGERYPGGENTDMSRDHTIYGFCAMKMSGMSNEDIYEIASHLRFRIGIKLGKIMTPDLWLWLRLISGKKIGYLYYPIIFTFMFFSSIGNWIIDKLTGLGVEQSQDEFKIITNNDRPKILKKLTDMYFPNYAVKLVATQLSILPNNWFNKKIKKQVLKMVKNNYALRLLLDDENIPTKEEINNYKPMSGDRWADFLNPWMTNSNLYILDEELLRANTLDKDYLLKIYENKYE